MQVYLGDTLVGDLQVPKNMIRHDRVVFTWHEMTALAPGGYMDDHMLSTISPSTINQITLSMAERTLAVSDFDNNLRGSDYAMRLLKAANAPDDYVKNHDSLRMTTRYMWKVLDVDQEIHEILFDMDAFTPADTEPDYDALRNAPAWGDLYPSV